MSQLPTTETTSKLLFESKKRSELVKPNFAPYLTHSIIKPSSNLSGVECFGLYERYSALVDHLRRQLSLNVNQVALSTEVLDFWNFSKYDHTPTILQLEQ